ncbi:MAG: hypothetical protein IJ911_02070 [Salinivirgaceae bacterium]|nr:hypothetical protein [Salinivirgaceae bacterium]
MARCDWCGRKIPDNGGVSGGGLLGILLGFNKHYCSNQCKHEAEASETSKHAYDDKSENLGCLGRIWRIIKIIIGVIVGLLILCYILS